MPVELGQMRITGDVPAWPEVDILGTEIDGDFPVTRLKSWKKFPAFVEKYVNKSDDEYIFRGQRHFSWDLIPSLARGNPTGVITDESAAVQLENFRRASRGRKSPNFPADDPDELWALAQHHGLYTPLLDWTYSPFVALFFAFERSDQIGDKSNESRIVFALNKTKIEILVDELVDESLDHESTISIFEPRADEHERLISQSGLFTRIPYENTLMSWLSTYYDKWETPEDLSSMILKIHLVNKGRKECLKYLNLMNINHKSLFPDITGAAQYSNMKLEIPGY